MPVNIQKYDPGLVAQMRIKILVYGEPGVGKTVYASTAPKPLFIDTEKGMASIPKKLDFVSINNFEEFNELLRDIVENPEPYKKYETLVVDSVSELQRRSLDTILNQAVKDNISRDPNLVTFADWGKNTQEMRRALRLLRDLGDKFNIVLTALSKEVETDGQLKERPDLTPALFGSLNSYVDVMGYLLAKADEKMEITRYLIFTNTEKFFAKTRIVVPKIIKDPNWDKFAKSLGKEEKDENKG